MPRAFSPIPASENLHSGEDFVVNFDVIGEDGDPDDMAGWSLTWVLRNTAISVNLVSKTVGDGISIVNGAATRDRARVLVDSADTVGLVAGTYYHHLERTDAGNRVVLAFGPVEMRDANIGEA